MKGKLIISYDTKNVTTSDGIDPKDVAHLREDYEEAIFKAINNGFKSGTHRLKIGEIQYETKWSYKK